MYGYNEEDYGTDVKFLSTSAMSDAVSDISVDTASSIDSYMSITPSEDGLAANLECEQSFGCPIILTCTVYDEMDNSVSEDIRLDYDSVLGSLGTLEDWVDVESEEEIEDALKTSCNIRLARDIECSVEIEHRTHLDLNGHTLSGEADVSKRARIENGKMTSSEDGIVAEGDEKVEITNVDIEARKTGVIANSNVEISNCSVTGTSAYGIYASGSSVAATACEIKSEASDADTHAAVYSASSASVTVNGGSVEGGVGAWAYTGDVTLEDVSVTSTAGDGLKAYQGTVKATGATVDSADSGAYCTNSGTVTLTSCTVTGTTYATYQSGGTLTVSGGTLSGPNGCYCSGGTTNLKDSCSVTATGSEGAAVREAGGTINLDSCSLSGYYGIRCSSGSITATSSCTFGTCTYGAYSDGGTINLNGAKMTSSVSSGAWANGGTIDIQSSSSITTSSYGVYSTSGTVNVYGSSAVSASSYGAYATNGTIKVYGSASVTSTGSYGAYLNGSGTLDLSGSATISGTSYGVYINNGSLTGEGSSTIEGNCGLYTKGTVNVTSATITGSSSYGIDIHSTSADTTLTSCTVSGSTHGIYGYYPGTLTIDRGSVKGASGSGIYCYDNGTVTISGTGSSNIAEITSTGSNSDYAGIYMCNYSSLNVTVGNYATVEGYYNGIYQMGGTLTVSGNSYTKIQTGNTSSSSYGINVADSSSSATVSGGSISGGNGVYASAGTITLESSCSVSVSTSSSYQCAAVWEAGGTITLTSCSLTGYYGIRCSSGSISVTSSCTIKSCTYGTYATGGTVNLNGCALTSSITTGAYATGGTINVYGSTSITASSYGAYADGGTINVYGSTSMSATSYGLYARSGKIYVYGSASVTSTGSYGAYVYGGYLKLYGSATISGTSYGVYVYSSSSSEFEMTAGTIKGTNALQMTNGTATITGGTLTATSLDTIYQSGGTLSCTATFSTAQRHQIYVTGGTATFTNCSVNGGSTYYALYLYSGTVTIDGSSSNFYSSSYYTIYVDSGKLYVENGNVYNSETSSASDHYVIYNNSGTVYINGGYVYNGSSRTADSSKTTAEYTIYNNTGTLYLNGGEVRNNNIVSSASTYAVYNVKGNVYGNGTEVLHWNYGYAFYNAAGTFNLAYGKYHSYYGPAIYVANTLNTSYIGTNVGINRSATPEEKQSACYIYKSGENSAYNDPVVQIAGGNVYIYGCYIESKYGPALKLTGSPYVWLGFTSTSGMYQDDSYTPCIEATVSGEYAIYVNMGSAGNLYCQEVDIYGVDYGIYIYDGAVGLTFVWITLSESSNDAYAIYVENRSTSYFNLSIYYEEVCAENMSSKKTVYGIYSANKNNKSSISYTTITYTTTGKSSTKTS